MSRALRLALAVLLAGSAPALSAPARVEPQRAHLAVSFFGETVGEVRLALEEGATSKLTYRSDLRVIRDRLRLRQQGLIEAWFDDRTGALVKARTRRCTGPADGSAAPTCSAEHTLAAKEGVVPALAAERLLARTADGAEHCLAIVDEESGDEGQACATATRISSSEVELVGSKFGIAFRARVRNGLLSQLELPSQGATFVPAEGAVELSDEDLFAGDIPAGGDAERSVRRGCLRVWLSAQPQALESLKKVQAPGQRLVEEAAGSLLVEVAQRPAPKGKRARKVLDGAAFLVAKAQGGHVDCQTATAWFLERAKERGWRARPAVGLAWVDGRFAFHAWAIVDTPEGPIPVDPLLAQVPADAGHVQLAPTGESAGALLVAFRRGLSLTVDETR